MSDRERLAETEPMAQRTAGLAAGLGAWILFSGIFFTGAGYGLLNTVVVGALIAAAAAYTAAFPAGGPLPSIVAPIVVVLLGLWTIASPFVFTMTGPLYWSCLVAGALVALLGATSVYGSWQVSRAPATHA